jgi:hypothetical protein
MDSETIKALKENEKPFGLMTAEMQAFAVDRETKDLLYYSQRTCSGSTEWLVNCNSPEEIKRDPLTAYRLRPDYEEKPEIVEWPIKKSDSGALCYYSEDFDICYNVINNALSNPDFIGFKYEGNPQAYPSPRRYRNPANGQEYIFWQEGWEVLTPTHVLFMKK